MRLGYFIPLLILLAGCATAPTAPTPAPATATATKPVYVPPAATRRISLAAAVPNEYGLQLAWTKPTGAVGSYKLYQTAGTLFTPVLATPATNAAVSGLLSNTTYRFYVTALNAAGQESAPSNVVTNREVAVVVPPPSTNIVIEAEAAVLASPMVAASDAKASGGRYVSSATANAGTARFTLTIPRTAIYTVWLRNLSPNSSTDSVWVSMDGATEVAFGTARGTWSTNWQWSPVSVNDGPTNAVLYPLTTGSHVLQFRGRDAGTKLDQVLLTTNRAFNPNVPVPPVVTNTPPTVTPIADRTVAWVKSWPGASFTFTIGDGQTPTTGLTVTATSSNTAIVPASGLVMSGTGATRTLTVTPAAGQSGTVTITVTVSDGVLTALDSFVLTIPH